MTTPEFDAVVLGAGAAGVCCAGELTARGANVALISEMPEVGWNIRARQVGGNTAFCQFPFHQVAWGGGWWYPLARKLDVPVQFRVCGDLDIWIRGSEAPQSLTMGASTAAVVALFEKLSPIPLDETVRQDLGRVLTDGFQMDYQELIRQSNVPLRDYLAERDASPVVQILLYLLCSNMLIMSVEMAETHASVFGLIATLRLWLMAEGISMSVLPDGQKGLLMPMAEAIEGKGGTVLRGRKASQVIIRNGRAVGVALADGTEVTGQNVVIATGTKRIPRLLDEPPDDVRPAIDYSALLASRDACLYAVLNRPIINATTFTAVCDEGGSSEAFLYPMHAVAPWSSQPGTQTLITQRTLPADEFDAAGGVDGVTDSLMKLNEDLFPGFSDALEAVEVGYNQHLWMEHFTHGPKLPRQARDIPGLWFGGDGAAPVGIAVEAAAGSGIVCAREIAATRA